jgi:reactive intermediate/imine deaminase
MKKLKTVMTNRIMVSLYTVIPTFLYTSIANAAASTETQINALQYISAGESAPFSTAVRVGDMLYLSGVIGDDSKGQLAKDISAQTTQTMDNIREILKKNDSSMDRVVQCKVILANLKDFAAMNKVYIRYFTPGRFPARTTFESPHLFMNAKIEIECIAQVNNKN